MQRKTFVIDTNVLLHDPDAIFKFHGADIVITMPVLEELDSLKKGSDELGKNARHVIRILGEYTQKDGQKLAEGIDIGNQAILRVLTDMRHHEKRSFPLPLDRGSHRLLWAAHMLKDLGHTVVLLSKDTLVRVKAESIGIVAEDYENLKESFDEIYKGYRKVEVTKKEIDHLLKDGSLVIEGLRPLPNEYVLLNSPENSTALCRYDTKGKRLIPVPTLQRDIWGIHPLNFEQKCAMDLLLRDDVKLVTLMGKAGTGKTLLALAAGLRKVFDEGNYNNILISRPIIPLGKDIGYLPGTKEEKLYHWMQPIYDNLEFLCTYASGKDNGSETQKWIMDSNKIKMEAVTYIRGRTLPKIYIIIDEAQNLTPHEIKTIISRAGQGTKVILTGDPTQIDNPYLDKDSNGLTFTVGKFMDRSIFGHILLERTERSELAAIAAEIL